MEKKIIKQILVINSIKTRYRALPAQMSHRLAENSSYYNSPFTLYFLN